LSIPLVKNLVIFQGEDYSNTSYTGILNANNSLIDFTSYTVTGQFFEDVQSNTFYRFTASGTSNSGVILAMNSATTANLVPRRYFYDVFGMVANNHSKLMEGILTVYPSIDPTFI
jgi:hypothetical protein